MATANQVVKAFEKKFPKLKMKVDGTAINVTGTEDGVSDSNGFTLFNYYAEDYEEKRYQMGVHNEVVALLDSLCWFAEWQNPGHIYFFEC